MKLESAVLQVEVVNGSPIPRGVRLGERKIRNVVTAAAVAAHDAPLRLELKINVAEVRTETVKKGEVVSCEVGGSMVGQTPALGYTVGELIDRLNHYPRDAQVGMNVGLGSNLEILSVYQSDGEPAVVWFDLGEEGAE